jgi:hypothetical protein
MLNKVGKEGKTSWDSFGYALMMAHNTYCHIVAVQRANNLADIETTRFAPDWREWKKIKDADMSDEYSDWVPRNILYFDRFVKELFKSETPMQMIEQARPMLNNMMGMRLKGGVAKNNFNSLYEEEQKTGGVEDFMDPEDEKLRELEELYYEQEAQNV